MYLFFEFVVVLFDMEVVVVGIGVFLEVGVEYCLWFVLFGYLDCFDFVFEFCLGMEVDEIDVVCVE